MRAGALTGAVLLAAGACGEPRAHLPEGLSTFDPELRARIRELAAVIEAHPRQAEAQAELGLLYEANRLWGAAAQSFERARELEPEQPLWIHHAALARHHAGLSERAMELLKQEAQALSDFAPAQQLLGVLELQEGRPAKALEAFDRCVELEADACEGWVGRGEALLALARPEEAARALERGLSLAPAYASAHYLLGLAYRETGLLEEAERELALGTDGVRRYMADALAPRLEQAKSGRVERLSRAHRLLALGRHVDALAELDTLLANSPDDLPGMQLRGRTLMTLERWEEAEANFDSLVRQRPGNGEGRSMRGVVRLRLKREEEGLADLEAALPLAPDSTLVRTNLAAALLPRERPQEALQLAREAVALDPEDQKACLLEVRALLALERWTDAQECLARIRVRWGSTPVVQRLQGRIARGGEQ